MTTNKHLIVIDPGSGTVKIIHLTQEDLEIGISGMAEKYNFDVYLNSYYMISDLSLHYYENGKEVFD